MAGTQPKYPKITVQIAGLKGNGLGIIAACARAMKAARIEKTEIEAMKVEMLAGDHESLIRTAERWVSTR